MLFKAWRKELIESSQKRELERNDFRDKNTDDVISKETYLWHS